MFCDEITRNRVYSKTCVACRSRYWKLQPILTVNFKAMVVGTSRLLYAFKVGDGDLVMSPVAMDTFWLTLINTNVGNVKIRTFCNKKVIIGVLHVLKQFCQRLLDTSVFFIYWSMCIHIIISSSLRNVSKRKDISILDLIRSTILVWITLHILQSV